MGDTVCLMHGISYASAIPSESIQGNAKHALSGSISFGRFMTDQSLSWEKWSTFSHKKYVEEAERYAQPGSVAQKKAFFEAHYKRIAAQKAAALLEEQIAAKTESKGVGDNNASETDVDVKMEEVKIQDSKQNDVTNVNEQRSIPVIENGKDGENAVSTGHEASSESPAKRNSLVNFGHNVTRSTKKSHLDSVDKKRSSSKSLRVLMNLIPIKKPDRDPISDTKKTDNSPKDCSTPFKNPVEASTKSVSSYAEPTPQSENIRIKIPNDPSAPGSKTGPKWLILSAVCSKSLRTEERAAKRKQKLEEKFNANELQKTLKAKTGNGFRKLSRSFCFKAQPSLDSYKDGETPRNQIEKTPVIKPQSAEVERSNSNKMHGSITVPTPPPPPTCPVKNSPAKSLSKK